LQELDDARATKFRYVQMAAINIQPSGYLQLSQNTTWIEMQLYYMHFSVVVFSCYAMLSTPCAFRVLLYDRDAITMC
jgi:hypothetical protein